MSLGGFMDEAEISVDIEKPMSVQCQQIIQNMKKVKSQIRICFWIEIDKLS